MIDPEMYRGGLKDSKNVPNSFFPKINWTVFWRLGTDMHEIFADSEHQRNKNIAVERNVCYERN